MKYKGWLHRRENGTITGGMLAKDAVVNEIRLPADTWVSFHRDGKFKSCHFPSDQTIQGHQCRGTGGGSKGAVVVFYPNGKLKEFFAPKSVAIQNVPCKGGLFASIQLHENGKLKQCTLSEAVTLDGKQLKQGTRITLDETGGLTSQ